MTEPVVRPAKHPPWLESLREGYRYAFGFAPVRALILYLALGSFVGSYVVGYLNGATGSPGASYVFMSVALLGAVVLTLAVKPPVAVAPAGKLAAR